MVSFGEDSTVNPHIRIPTNGPPVILTREQLGDVLGEELHANGTGNQTWSFAEVVGR